MKEQKIKARKSALIPLIVFIAIYLGAGITLQIKGVDMAFYQFPSPVAIVIGIVVAFFLFKGTMEEKFSLFAKGCGDENVLTMCFIYLFAGAFARVASDMGGVDSVVNLGISVIPPQYIPAGLFVISAFIAVATGSSMGTISAIGVIAVAISEKAGLNGALVIAAIVGGAMFGDNLSMISDTTIAATRTQGVEMSDKFKVNLTIAIPPAVLTFLLLLIFGKPEVIIPVESLDFQVVKMIPYIIVLVLAIIGFNVFITLGLGIVVAGAIGIFYGDLNILTWAQGVYNGFTSMTEIFLLSLFAGGLAYMVTQNGGLEWLIEKIKKLIRGERSAEVGIAAIASLADCAIANNTIAIIITGPIAKELCESYRVDPRKSASLLDIWACVFQGLIPYGAQILLAISLTAGTSLKVSPLDLIPLLWYQMLLAVFAIISIFIPYDRLLIKKRPWDFITWRAKEEK